MCVCVCVRRCAIGCVLCALCFVYAVLCIVCVDVLNARRFTDRKFHPFLCLSVNFILARCCRNVKKARALAGAAESSSAD